MRKTIIEALQRAHHNMEQVLTLLRMQLDMLDVPARKDALTFLNNAVFYMHNFPGLTHHPVEEIIFTHLRERAPGSAELCDWLSGQHKSFRDQEAGLLQHIREFRGGTNSACWRVKELGANYCTTHADHIGFEENGILPQAARHLREEDWVEVDKHSQGLLEQVSTRDELRRFDTLYDYLMADGGALKLH